MLTKRQFNKTAVAQKPGASYGGYVRWVTKTRAKRAATANQMSGVNSAIGTPSALATGDVNAQIQAALAGERSATTIGQQQANQQAKRAQGFALALAKLNAPDPAAISKVYNDAASRIQGLGAGLTGAVAAGQHADAQRIAADVAQATGGLGHVTGYDPDQLSSLAQYSGVTIPATNLGEQATSAYTHAQGQGEANARQVETIAQQYLAKVTDLQNQMAAKRTEIEQKRPDLFRQALQSREAQALQARSEARQAQQAREAHALALRQEARMEEQDRIQEARYQEQNRQQQANYIQDYREKVREFNASQRTDATKAALPDSSLSNALGYLVDTNGNVIGGRPHLLPGFVVKNGRVVKALTPTAAAKAASGGLTTKDVATIGAQVAAAFKPNTNPNYDRRYDPNSSAYNKDLSDPSKPIYDKDWAKKMHKFVSKPANADTTMRYLHALYPHAYAQIYRAMLPYAKVPGSRWAGILNWQGPGVGGSRRKKKGR